MKKVLYPIISFVATVLLCVDFMYKYQANGFPNCLSTIAIIATLAAIMEIMVRIDLACVKNGKGIIFRPPFLKSEYFEDIEKYKINRYGVYGIFGALVGVMFYLSRSEFTSTIPEIIEIAAIAFNFTAYVWVIFEGFIKKYTLLKNSQK